MSNRPNDASKPKLKKIRQLLKEKNGIERIATLAQFVERIGFVSNQWQEEDWLGFELDEDYVLNKSRLVGQTWFRGQCTPNDGLRPGLYRDDLWRNLQKSLADSKPDGNINMHLFDELFEIEHELRIDFVTHGHLLNASNHAKTDMDWYFLMQHHGVPTRLLDWTTNALAALFFSLDGLGHRLRLSNANLTVSGVKKTAKHVVAVWMIDAYWLAMRMSEGDWGSPLLSWSEDAHSYVSKLENLVENMNTAKLLVPAHPMPIEPPFVHPRVAAQEGKFIIFGRIQDLLDQRIRLQKTDNGKVEEFRVRKFIFEVTDIDKILCDLSQLGVSKRTLFPDLAGLADFVQWKNFHKLRGYQVK